MAELIGTSLKCVGEGISSLKEIPAQLLAKAREITELNCSHNNLTSFDGLAPFAPTLETLIVDGNQIPSFETLPIEKMISLKTLWANKNCITGDPTVQLRLIQQRCPCLEYLSIMFNPIVPHELTGQTEQAYRRHRIVVKYLIPTLTMIDCEVVTEEETAQAATRGQFTVTRAPESQQHLLAPATSTSSNSPLATNSNPASASFESSQGPLQNKPSSFVGATRSSEPPETLEPAVFTQQTRFYKASDGNRYITNDQL